LPVQLGFLRLSFDNLSRTKKFGKLLLEFAG
jgi:hypothetical protein